ncbi:MAG: hypothetical protein ACI974_001360, partial [Paraglaciecola sp.]
AEPELSQVDYKTVVHCWHVKRLDGTSYGLTIYG